MMTTVSPELSEYTSVRPRSLAHRGVIEAAGILFDMRVLSEQEARRRVLSYWRNGASVYRVKNGYLLRLPAQERIVCEHAPGAPLVMQSDSLLTAPLSPDELRALSPPEKSLISLQNGFATIEALLESAREDPADWISLTDWQSLPVTSLGAPPDPPRLVAEPAKFDPRSRLPGVPSESPQRAEALKALQLALHGTKADDAASPNLRQAAGHFLQRLAKLLKERGQNAGNAPGRTNKSGAPVGSNGLAVVPARPAPPDQNLLDRLAEQMNFLAARLLMASGLAEQVGRKQAAYMRRMIEMFERGELDEGLRHAIGLSEMEAGGRPLPPLLRTPTPRSDLTLSAEQTPARSSLNTDTELFMHLRAIYRKAFEKLEAEGRIDEAAFVLAELLGSNEEAVAFLERHGKLQLAAEMAEARNLPPGLIIRLWFLLGNRERVAQIARKTGAFADAVQKLARVDSAKASELRMFWAATLAQAGDYGAAVEALWPEVTLRPLTLEWIDNVLALGGPVAASMLARRLTIVPDDKPTCDQAISLLEDEQAETAPERLAFSAALLAYQPSPSFLSKIARLAVRALLRDAGNGVSSVRPADFQSLLQLAGDGALRADVPSVPVLPSRGLLSPTALTSPMALGIQAADTGILPIYDAALLPGGQSIVALGEAGVRLVSRDGRSVVHFEQPTHRLVLSDNGDRAILLAPRGEAWRMAKLDLIKRRAEPWREAIFRAFAPTYDGALWFVSIADDLTAIDVTSSGFDALWRMPHLDGRIVSLARSRQQCSFLLYQKDDQDPFDRTSQPRQERWTYALPTLMLRDRNDIPLPSPSLVPGKDVAAAITADGIAVYFAVQPHAERSLAPLGEEHVVLSASDPRKGVLWEAEEIGNCTPLPPAFSPDWAMLSTLSAAGITCRLLDRRDWKLRASFILGGASTVSARFTDSRLTLGDNRGRLVALDLSTGDLLRNLRMK